jgi:hypothetical protein
LIDVDNNTITYQLFHYNYEEYLIKLESLHRDVGNQLIHHQNYSGNKDGYIYIEI